MILTGKTLEQFEEWYRDVDKSGIKSMPYTTLRPYVCFLNIDFSMQYGIIVDFFDQCDVEGVEDTVQMELSYMAGGHTREDSRKFAVDKNNKRFNQSFKQ